MAQINTDSIHEIMADTFYAAWESAYDKLLNRDTLTPEDRANIVHSILGEAHLPAVLCCWDPILGTAIPLPLEWYLPVMPATVTMHQNNLDRFDEKFGLPPGTGLKRFQAAYPHVTTINFIPRRPARIYDRRAS